MAKISGYHHLSLTVRQLDASARWYTDVLGLEVEADVQGEGFVRKRLRAQEGAILTLTQHERGSGDTFNERRTGMDHFAFQVGDDEIDEWKRRFEDLGVTHSGIENPGRGTAMITLRDPDNIQLEIFSRSSSS